MRRALTLVFALTALTALAGLWWWTRADPRPSSRAASPEAAQGPAASTERAPAPVEGVRPVAERVQESVAPGGLVFVEDRATTVGTLVVHVTWPASDDPAAGVSVSAWSSSSPSPHAYPRRAACDSSGVATFADMRAGGVVVRADRSGEARGEVLENATCELAIELEPGLALRGRTLDAAGRPVAHAELWVFRDGTDRGGQLLASADNTGNFAVRDVVVGCWLQARARDKSPSIPTRVEGQAGAASELELYLGERGATLLGQVVDPAESPVIGAGVCVIPTYGVARGDAPRPWFACRTESDGRFALHGLEPGDVRLVVLFPGFAPLDESTAIALVARDERILRLERGGTVSGRVRFEGGAGAGEVEVRLGRDGEFLDVLTHTQPDGSFRLQGLPPGRIELGVAGQVFELEVRPDAITEWNPTLTRP